MDNAVQNKSEVRSLNLYYWKLGIFELVG